LNATRATAAALVIAPLLFLADNLLHPEEFDRGHEAEQLAAIADAYTRWQLAHALGFAATVVFAGAVLGLAYLVWQRRPRAGLAGGALALVGVLGLAAAITIDGYAWGIVGAVSAEHTSDPETVERTLEVMQDATWSYVYYLTPLGFILGLIVLAAAAWRAGLVPAWSAALMGLAVLMVGSETAIPENAYFVAGSAVFLAAGVSFATALLRAAPEPPLRPGSACA
jgi:hypothetical protein